jgi:hypothetical protein
MDQFERVDALVFLIVGIFDRHAKLGSPKQQIDQDF